jgi:3-hydroxy acid dehydrogenase/malonic semialdehyde reductase
MLKNKVVLITGASSGIGAACAEQFAQAGARLLLCGRRLEALKSVAQKLQQQYGVEVYSFKLDVRHQQEVNQSLQALPDSWQDIEILINNAGLAAGLDPLQLASVQDWDEMIDTNVKGLLYVTRNVLPRMVAKNSGHIINIGSIAGHEVYPKGAVYCATKHAVGVLSNGLRMDLLGTKIRVSTVSPGAVETNFSVVRFKGDAARAAAIYEGMEALTPADVANAVIYCAASPAHVNISEVVIMPTDQACATMVARSNR